MSVWVLDKKAKKYEVTYTMSFDTLAGNLSYDFTATFDRQDDNKYYLNWYSDLIIPELEEIIKLEYIPILGQEEIY